MLKTINITGVEIKQTKAGDKMIVMDSHTKYEFFQTKQDGGETKAYTQWKEFEMAVGKQVEAEVEEEPQEFTGKEGNQIKYTRRTIKYFKTDQHEVPYQRDGETQGGTGGRTQCGTCSVEYTTYDTVSSCPVCRNTDEIKKVKDFTSLK